MIIRNLKRKYLAKLQKSSTFAPSKVTKFIRPLELSMIFPKEKSWEQRLKDWREKSAFLCKECSSNEALFGKLDDYLLYSFIII